MSKHLIRTGEILLYSQSLNVLALKMYHTNVQAYAKITYVKAKSSKYLSLASASVTKEISLLYYDFPSVD
jgi:hypothetical protein